MAFFAEKEVCPACNGEKEIVCCSCGDDDAGCSTMPCPYCQGSGVIKHYNYNRVFVLMGIVMVAAMAMFWLAAA